jgi:hypothetical protein
MTENEKTIFELGTIAAGMEIAFTASLRRLRKALGPQAAEEMARMEETFVRDVKNFTPVGPVPDDVMQAGVERLIGQVRAAFAAAR